MLLSTSLLFRRLTPATLVLPGLVVYALACVGLFEATGRVELAPALYGVLGLWAVGLVAMLVMPTPRAWLDSEWLGPETLTFVKCVWANGGVVISALFVPESMRLLFLVVALLGILHAALHLPRQHVAGLTLITWVAYLAVHSLLYAQPALFDTGELLLTAGFTGMLALMFLVTGEVAALRSSSRRRTDRLNQALRSLSNLAMRDDLTGLYNRRHIMEVLNRQKALADRGHVGFTLCYCDLDHFKRINDTYGHQQGDGVLQAFARSAEQVVRSVDYVARFGGEEFLLLLVDADAAAARRVASRLASRIRSLDVLGQSPDCGLSVSIGLAEFRAGESVEDVIERADRALYQAKSAGRDQIVEG